MVVKGGKSKGNKTSSPAIVQYLAAVDQYYKRSSRSTSSNKDDDGNSNNNSNSNSPKILPKQQQVGRLTENVHSLLKDVVNTTDDIELFDSFVSSSSSSLYVGGGADHHLSNTTTKNTEVLLDEIASRKIAKELNHLYDEYTFATAKDASLTDDLRRDNKTTNQHTENSLVYGEIELESFHKLLQEILPSSVSSSSVASETSLSSAKGEDATIRETVFYDIGSGSGRAVFAARFVQDFDRCVGIELLPNLHQLAVQVKSLYQILYRHKLRWQAVEFHCADLLQYDWWSDGTVIYAPSLLFDDAMMAFISHQAKQLQPGAFLISLKKFADMDPTALTMVQETVLPMSWGSANVYVYRRC